MGAEEIATTIVALLTEYGAKFKYNAEGHKFAPGAPLIWDSIVVEARHPKTGELHRLHSLDEAREFLKHG